MADSLGYGLDRDECGNCGGEEWFVLTDDLDNVAGFECRDCGEVRLRD